MAVKIFNGSDSAEAGLDGLYNWLSSSDITNGTFLSGTVIDLTDGDLWDHITITKGSDVFHLKSSSNDTMSDINEPIAWIDPYSSDKAVSFWPYYGASTGYRWISIRNAYLCKNGLIIKMYYRIRTYDWNVYAATRTTMVLTVDENNKLVLAFIEPRPGSNDGSGNETAPTSFYVCSKESIATYYKPTPWAQQVHTNIHQVALSKSDGSAIKVPNLYVADATQCATSNYGDVYTTALGGVVYMTNGIWYVKDE